VSKKDPSKTEAATPKRIQEARRDGNVLMSQDIIGIITTLGGILLLIITAKKLHAVFIDIFALFPTIDFTKHWSDADLINGIHYGAKQLWKILAAPLLGLSALIIFATRIQTGAYFETKPLEWKLDGLDPIKGFSKVLPTQKNIVKLLQALGKVGVVGLIIYTSIKRKLDEIIALSTIPLPTGINWMLKNGAILILNILGFFVLIAIADYFYQRYQYYDNLQMSKQDIKDETKNSEGDPQIKAKLRQKMRELTTNRLVTELPKADVVITNPIHVAIALQYEQGMAAPKIVARGLRKRALLIKQMAKEHKIPIVENPQLARSLYRHSKAGGYIESNFFHAVAIILAKLQQNGQRKFVENKA